MRQPFKKGANVNSWLRRAVALVAPPQCAICAQPCHAHHTACNQCAIDLRRAPTGLCRLQKRGGLDGLFAAHEYAGVARETVRALKYSGRTSLAPLIADQIVERMPPALLSAKLALVPVPAHPANARQRGFNQALLIAKSLGKLLDAPVLDCLERRGSRLPQSQLNRAERLRLPASEFTVSSGRRRHSRLDALAEFPTNVVVCDDVTTTTCTLERCASAIRVLHSVQTIHGLTFASVSQKDNSAGHGTTDWIA